MVCDPNPDYSSEVIDISVDTDNEFLWNAIVKVNLKYVRL
jgi:hypothetical protein